MLEELGPSAPGNPPKQWRSHRKARAEDVRAVIRCHVAKFPEVRKKEQQLHQVQESIWMVIHFKVPSWMILEVETVLCTLEQLASFMSTNTYPI